LVVCCGDGALELLDIQLEGKKRMAVSDWLKGAQISAGDQFES
jgi:methionyl-tRNA formyltransferase